jgi:hypothetical protein
VDALVGLLAPGGHLFALLFDADSPEQRLVTQAWETIAPTPFGDRGYTRKIFTDALASAEEQGEGTLRHSHLRGFAVAADAPAARWWFTAAHFKDLPALTGNRTLMAGVEEFIAGCAQPDGTVPLPAGVQSSTSTAPTVTKSTTATPADGTTGDRRAP